MTTLGRNFSFRQSPLPQQRLGRFKTGDDPIIQGAPVRVPAGAVQDPLDLRLPLELATGDVAPTPGTSGILVYEVDPGSAFAGNDPVLTRPSDLDTAPANTPVQLVHGDTVRVVFENTEARSFQGQRDYAGRVIVAGVENLAVGDLLGPGTGDDTAGYWTEAVTPANAWLRVTGVDSDYGLVEAQMLF